METLRKLSEIFAITGGALAVNGFLLMCIHQLLTEKFVGRFENDFYVFLIFTMAFLALDIVGAVYLVKRLV